MFKIGVCDDDRNDMEIIHKFVTKALFEYEDISVVEYTSGDKVIKDISDGTFDCRLLLLDIYMNGSDGIETAEYIRSNKVDVDIIFITNSAEYVYQGYKVKAFSYVLKSRMESEIEGEIKRYMEEVYAADVCLNILANGKRMRIPVSDITYAESDGRKLILHLENEKITFYGKMSELMGLLGERGFIRIHQSYLVKKQAISSVQNTFVNVGDVMLPISRRYFSKVIALVR